VKIEDMTADTPEQGKTELKVTDNTNLLFDVNINSTILPNVSIGDVIRISRLRRP